MKRVALWSAFLLAVVVLGFLLHPTATWLVQAVNDGVSSGCQPAYSGGDGWCWSRPYTRFVPTTYEPGVSLGLDLGLSSLLAAALFHGINQRKQTRAVSNARSKSNLIKRRLWLIPAWLVAQYIWNLFSGMSGVAAFETMTSIESLWISAVVITFIVLYANNYQLAFGKEAKQTKKPIIPQK